MRARTLLQAVMSDFQMYPGALSPRRSWRVRCSRTGSPWAWRSSSWATREVFRVFEDFSGLGETGETVVAMQAGDEMTFVAPTRFDQSSAFRLKIPIGGTASEGMQRGAGETRIRRRTRLSK